MIVKFKRLYIKVSVSCYLLVVMLIESKYCDLIKSKDINISLSIYRVIYR